MFVSCGCDKFEVGLTLESICFLVTAVNNLFELIVSN